MNNGISYFPLDVHLDDKIKLIEAEFGLKGFAVIVKLYQKIYGEQGYYCEWTKDIELLFSRENGLSDNLVSEIVSASIKRGIFDENLYDKYRILTSGGIQKRYFDVVSRRKKVEVTKEYLLIDVDKNYKNVNILSKNAYISAENVNIFEQRKVKERKGKERKENNNTAEAVVVVPPKIIDTFQNNIAPITPIILHSMEDWLKDIDADMLEWAIAEAVRHNKRNWKYVEGILNNHFRAGRTTLAAVEDAARNYKGKEDGFGVYYDEFDHDALEELTRK